ncbi:MAG: hypothetical protein IJP62_05930 [Treponema sp.]|nr:hypothetical protein [Treponema sp.]
MDKKEKSFGNVAILCVKKCIAEKSIPSSEDWLEFAKINGFSDSMAKKGCPKSAFLGLCQEGLVKYIPKGKYTSSQKNKKYALEAVEILKTNNSMHDKPDELWRQIPSAPSTHNHQMDVVCALWNAKLLNV